MGRYVPPDQEGVLSFNQVSGKGHPLGARARKLKSEGILTVRFECPFAIWCTICQPEVIIGQGVRFNAEKKKVGNYYSTPIWQFRFKHTVCGGWLEVRTDPKESEYAVIEGGRRRDTGEGKLLDGEVRVGMSEKERDELEKEGGFGALEKKVEDKKAFENDKARLEQLAKRSERDWEDPYEQSKRLRKEFRIGRNERKVAGVKAEALKDKLSLAIDLEPEHQNDVARARLVDFRGQDDISILHKPLFSDVKTSQVTLPSEIDKSGRKTKAVRMGEASKQDLQSTLSRNSRAVIDPFHEQGDVWVTPTKRRKVAADNTEMQPSSTSSGALVAYESD